MNSYRCYDCGKIHSRQYMNYVYENSKKGICKKCSKVRYLKFVRSINGLIKDLYSNQVKRSKQKQFNMGYSLKEFENWMLARDNFKKLYDNWVHSNWDIWLRPSVDRLDNAKGYSFDNIRLVTWLDNWDKDIFKNIKKAYESNRKKVIQMDKDGNIIGRFNSTREVRKLGFDPTGIARCCRGGVNTSYGYKWKYQ